MTDALRAPLRAGHVLAGTVLTLPGVTAAQLVAEPFEVVWVDLEHAALPARARSAEQTARTSGADALLVGSAELAHAIDAGIDAQMIAAVTTVRAAAAAAAMAQGIAGALGRAPAELLTVARILIRGTDARLCAAAVNAAEGRLRMVLEPIQEATSR